MHHDPMEINNAARADVVKITNPHPDDQQPVLPAGPHRTEPASAGTPVPGRTNGRGFHPACRMET